MKRMFASILVGSFFSAACGGGSSSAQADAQKAAAALTGNDTQTAADNPQCKLFTRTEIAKYVGEPVSAPGNSVGGCQWLATGNGGGDVTVAIVPAEYYEPPTRAKGFKGVPDVGTKGFVAPWLNGWVAGAIVGKDTVRVSLSGPGANETTAIALLKDTIHRTS